jgi:hypothetical protein
MIRYAGVPLAQPTPELVRWGRENLDWSWLPLWASREWPGRSLSRLGVGLPFPKGPARLGTLVWPSGASRFAHGLFLATDPQLAAVRAAVYPSPGGPAPAPFVLSDGVDSVATDLWMLPPRPLQQAAGAETPWLLPLVDERLFWWFRAAAVAVAADGSTTWAQLFGSLAAALGVVLSYDPVPAAAGASSRGTTCPSPARGRGNPPAPTTPWSGRRAGA